LLRFKVHQLQLGGKHYLLLPKLNAFQIEALAKRFTDIGAVRRGAALVFSSREGKIRVSDEGLCWSSFDLSDAVLPAIPALLSCPKEKAPAETVMRKYSRAVKSREGVTFRIFPRLESSSRWRELRASGGCALAPDEHALVSFLLERTRGKCKMVTDFLVEGSTPLVLGRKRYFDSSLAPDEAISTLRVVGERGQRNSYIPGDGSIGPTSSTPSLHDWFGLFADLGEWCPFTPV
jgi:hypothetical protein